MNPEFVHKIMFSCFMLYVRNINKAGSSQRNQYSTLFSILVFSLYLIIGVNAESSSL